MHGLFCIVSIHERKYLHFELRIEMGSEDNALPHFVLFPFMAQGHMIPMVDIAKLLAGRGVIVTLVTTPVNAARHKSAFDRAKESGLPIRLVQLRFPCAEAGLPEGCENFDMVPSPELTSNFFNAASMLQDQVESLFEELTPRPRCIISDMCLPYTMNIARKFQIPRLSFSGFGCLAALCFQILRVQKFDVESLASESESFVLPGIPGEIKYTVNQLLLPQKVQDENVRNFLDQMSIIDSESYGAVVNSFEELETAIAEEYRKVRGGKVWYIGPVSLCNKDSSDKAQRGNQACIDEHECLKWLDSKEPGSVVYACLGSLCSLACSQLLELGLGLEASGKPFIWVLRGNNETKQLEKWIEENGFEERIEGRGLLIRGWSPQVLILSHPAVGGFLTHCGWNSTLEGVTAGLPLITWPLFADQFSNEKLAVEVLKTGVSVGADTPTYHGEAEKVGVRVRKEDVAKAVKMLMDEGEEATSRREIAREFGKKARRAVEEGGSAYLNTTKLIQEFL